MVLFLVKILNDSASILITKYFYYLNKLKLNNDTIFFFGKSK